jgi:hypothetical protein
MLIKLGLGLWSWFGILFFYIDLDMFLLLFMLPSGPIRNYCQAHVNGIGWSYEYHVYTGCPQNQFIETIKLLTGITSNFVLNQTKLNETKLN